MFDSKQVIASSIVTFLNLPFVSWEKNVAVLLETSRNASPADTWNLGQKAKALM